MRHRRIYFRPVGVGEGTNLLPLAEIIEREDLGSRALLLCDIEGSELSKGFRHNLDLSRFKQISIELHNLGELFIRGRIPDLLSLVTSLTKDHQPIHIHANNFDSVNNFADLPLPETLEVTLVRRTDYRFGGRITRFPRDFDRPNSSLLPDTAWSIPETIFDEPGPAGAEASSRSPSNPPK